MTAVLLTPLTGQFFDNNGLVLNGGLIHTYSAGTTTPLATYTDATGSTPAANPIVLDSSGRANVWGSGVYKFVITDSLGNTLQTIDNVTAIYGSGDMQKSVYDASNISQQLLGTTAVQNVQNKTFDATNTINGSIITGNISGNPVFLGNVSFGSLDRMQSSVLTKTNDASYSDIPGIAWVLVAGTYRINIEGRIDQGGGGNRIQSVTSGTFATSTYSSWYEIWNSSSTTAIATNIANGAGQLEATTVGAANWFKFTVFFTITSGTMTFKLQGGQNTSNAASSAFSAFSGLCRFLD